MNNNDNLKNIHKSINEIIIMLDSILSSLEDGNNYLFKSLLEAQDILKNGPENYMNFLKKGSSDKPINLLKSAGIDLSNKKTIQVSIDKFNSLLQELEKLTNN